MRADVKKQDNGPESSTTVVELIVCQMQYDANLSLAASNILDRVEKRRADRGADLLKLIDKVEVRDRVSCRGPTGSNYVLLLLAVIVVLASYHGCWAECLSFGSCTRSVLGSAASDKGREASLLKLTTRSEHPAVSLPDASRLTLMLDLDHTSLFGNDGNDMGIVLQHMNKSYSTMQLLYDKLINPNLRTMFEAYKAQGKEIQVVVYTRRPALLRQYAPHWHANGQIYFPASIASSREILETYAGPRLSAEDEYDVQCALDRLLSVRLFPVQHTAAPSSRT